MVQVALMSAAGSQSQDTVELAYPWCGQESMREGTAGAPELKSRDRRSFEDGWASLRSLSQAATGS